MHLKNFFKEYRVKSRKQKASVAYKIKKNANDKKNIIFILPTNKNHKAGGDKVIYRQSQIINEMKPNGFSSQVLHPFDPGSFLDWFEHDVVIKKDLYFDPDNDIVVVPEIWAAPHGNLLDKLGVKYAIYVQNGYSMSTPTILWHYEDLATAYNNASLIIAISDDTAENIKIAFPELSHKVIRNFYSVDSKKFNQVANKEALITYMPRKLAQHSSLVNFFIQSRMPEGWSVMPIEGLDEKGVVELLGKSTIFLSFSEFEGCPLPPVEAAISGNHVIGYTGQGAKEYWDPVIYTEINNGDIKSFCNAILLKIKQIEEGDIDDDAFLQAREMLINRYSESSEIKSLESMVQRLASLA